MSWRSTERSWWRRFDHIHFDLPDVARHEGVGTALTVLRHRLGNLLKYGLFSSVMAFKRKANGPQARHLIPSACKGKPKPAVLFIGYVEAALGLGVSLRALINSTAETDIPFAILPYNTNVETRFAGPFRPESYDFTNCYAINIIETAADQLPIVFENLGQQRIGDSYNILRTYWELPYAPEKWRKFLEPIDEIWAPNVFVADAFRSIFSRTISIIPPCVEIPEPAFCNREQFGLRADTFYFLFSFDYFSYPSRKNPIAVLRAFQAAFPSGDEPVGLVIKSTGAESQFPDIRAIISAAARRDSRIVIIERSLSQNEIASLINSCDCYVSLHRSEGFGLGMVEAMLCGKPVIGTDFSGSQDFLSSATGYPVANRLRPLRRGEYIHYEGQVWAEPDMASAIEAMRAVVSDPEGARHRAVAGLSLAQARYSRYAVAALAAARIQVLLNDSVGLAGAVVPIDKAP